jgi:hypothetical protein
MTHSRLALSLYVLGLFVMAADVGFGKWLDPLVREAGVGTLMSEQGGAVLPKLLLFAFSLPLGLGLSLLGAMAMTATAALRLGKFAGILGLLILIPIFLPALAGKHASPLYFGMGGIGILILVSVFIWHWGRLRAKANKKAQAVLDWQMLGYASFALAAWNLCGFGGMPSYAVYPELMLATGAVPFGVGQLKSVMALFVLGWVFTAIAFFQSVRNR